MTDIDEEIRKLLRDPKVTELLRYLHDPQFISRLDRIVELEKACKSEKNLTEHEKFKRFIEANLPAEKQEIALKTVYYCSKATEYKIKYDDTASKLTNEEMGLLLKGLKQIYGN